MKGKHFYLSAISGAIMTAVVPSAFAAIEKVEPAPVGDIVTAKGTIIQHADEAQVKGPLEMNSRVKRSLDNILSATAPLTGDWFNQDPTVDGIEGSSVDRVYDTFSLYRTEPVIVAVIDSGVDVHHEDLQGKIWENPNEIPNNGIDDDLNGYVDDIYGWNFIGGRDGSHVDQDTLVVTREYKRFLFYKETGIWKWLSKEEKKYFRGVKKDYLEKSGEATKTYNEFKDLNDQALVSKVVLESKLNQTDFSLAALKTIKSDDAEVQAAADFLVETFTRWRSFDYLAYVVDYYSTPVNYYYNLDFDPRVDIVKDQPYSPWESDYGNNDVIGPDSSHGTHVSGIIAADRNNALGIRGVANNVKIMALRAVPNGDERDKDIANSVRYAVDNGAKIINMSFGKAYSPYKGIVDEAFRYAARKGVLLVHAAGNSETDNDIKPSFPNRYPVYYPNSRISTWLDVGASANYKDESMVASFSNFGQKSVDLFAPGYKIMSTTPGNEYDAYSGTSMASPVVAGVAALALSQFPELEGKELKEAIMDSVRLYEGHLVKKPSTPELLVPFSELSLTGGIVDSYQLMQDLYDQQ